MTRGEELVYRLLLCDRDVQRGPFDDAEELKDAIALADESRQAVIDAIDGREGYVMVEVPTPGTGEVCALKGEDGDRCWHPEAYSAECDYFANGYNPPAWCPLIGGNDDSID